ncbi:TB2/DP1 HVA22 family protein [Cryptosporidium felis]|nr:TB2/DP1 HVA22 family protein [Cryptosporidium felis]
MLVIIGLLKFLLSFCIPVCHSLVALRNQDRRYILIWLVYFLTITFNELILSVVLDPLLRSMDPRIPHLKGLFVVLYIFPETGFRDSYLKFLGTSLNKIQSMLTGNGRASHKKTDSCEELSTSSSPSPSIPEEGDIKTTFSIKESISEGTTFAPNTPVGKLVPNILDQ